MVRGIRTAFFWLLLVVLPLYGIAGGTTQDCATMPMHASQLADASTHAVGTAAGDDSSSFASVNPGPSGCQGMAAGDRSSSSPGSNCMTSPACGVVAAPAVPAPEVAAAPVASALPAARPFPRVGFLTDAPDRPPRVPA